MSSLRPAFLTRIGGQMAMLIIASLIGIHAVVGAGFYLTHRLESTRVLDSGPGEIITAARLVAAVPSEPERTAMIAHIAGAFPRMQFERASTMPAARAPSPRRMAARSRCTTARRAA